MRIDLISRAAFMAFAATLSICGPALLAGCATDRPGAAAGNAVGGGPAGGGTAAQPLANEPAYLRLKPEQTGIQAVHDDGRLTYLTFAAPPPSASEPATLPTP